jgi:hypothetical protein
MLIYFYKFDQIYLVWLKTKYILYIKRETNTTIQHLFRAKSEQTKTKELQLRSGRRDTGGQPLGATAARPHSLSRKSLSQAQHMILPVLAVRPGISVIGYQGPPMTRHHLLEGPPWHDTGMHIWVNLAQRSWLVQSTISLVPPLLRLRWSAPFGAVNSESHGTRYRYYVSLLSIILWATSTGTRFWFCFV